MKKIVFMMLSVMLLAAPCVWAEGENKPSKEIENIINGLKTSDWTLDVSGFNMVENKNITEDPLKGEYEEYVFPPPSVQGADMYRYVIKVDKKTRKFWIWRTGGFYYQNILYGPGFLDNSGNIIKKVE